MKKYYIYRVINKKNGKIYIGQTCHFKKRKEEHLADASPNSSSIFHRALFKYGEENFIWDIIAEANSKKEANELEKRYIFLCCSFKPFGYNMTKGGDGGSMWNARPIVCLTLEGEFVKRYESADEAEEKDGFWSSNVLLSCRSNTLTCLGFMFMYEDEYYKYGPKKYIPAGPNNEKVIIQCNLDGHEIERFKSAAEASRKLGIDRSSISACALGITKTAGGYIFVFEKDYPIKNPEDRIPKKKGRRVAQVDEETGEVIACYDRIADAGRALGVSYKAIHKVVDKPNRTAYGFRWISQ